MGVGASLVVALLVLPPLAAVVMAGSWGGAESGPGGGFAPLHHLDVVLNTLLFGLLTTLCAMVVGGGLALALAPGVPGRALLERLVVLPLYLTPLLLAMGWSWLASPKSGLLNLLLHAAFGSHVTINIVSAAGAVAVTALAATPLPYLLLSDALSGLDPSLSEAARVYGGMPSVVLRRIILPLLSPAALASAVLVFVQAIGMFSVPAVLGLPAGFNVATTEIYRSLEGYPPRTADATAWGMLLLATTALLTFAQAAVLRRRSFVTMTGKAFRPTQHPPRGRRLRAAMAAVYVALATVLPMIALLWAASVAFITADIRLMRFTPRHFLFVLRDYPKTWLAAANSVTLGVLTASLVCLLSLAVSWTVLRTRQSGRDLLDQLSMIPLSMPAMVFALGLLWVYVRVPLPVYGTTTILLIAYATHYLPFGVRATSAALRQLHPELEEAARVTGASWPRTMREITMPLVRPAMLTAWVLLFVMSMQEVSSSILLYSSHSIVLSVAVFDLWENGNAGDVAALGFLQLIVSAVIVGLMLGLRQRRVIE